MYKYKYIYNYKYTNIMLCKHCVLLYIYNTIVYYIQIL